METELKFIITKLYNGDLDKWSNDSNIKKDFSTTPNSTAVRTLLSEEDDTFKKYYKLTNVLSNYIYELYYQDNKTIPDLISKEDYIEEIKKGLNVSDFFWKDEYWQYDQDNNRIRKESRKRLCDNGYFYIKELLKDEDNAQNIELIHSKRNLSSKDTYSYIYGRLRDDSGYSLRFYFNFLPKSVTLIKLLEALQRELDNAQIPFEFKFLSDPQMYLKQNHVGVLYVPRMYGYVCFSLLNKIYKKIKVDDNGFFCKSVPMFTCLLQKGLSFGEDPDDRRFTSFGQCRAIHIAMAIVKIKYSDSGIVNVKNIVKFLQGKGFNPDAFYCNPNSLRDYNKEIDFFEGMYYSENTRYAAKNNNNVADNYLKAAITCAEKICKEAIWQISKESDCNWVQYEGQTKNDTSTINKFAKMDDGLLNGRMGIAYFLYQLNQIHESNDFIRVFYYIVLSVSRKQLSTLVDCNWALTQISYAQLLSKKFVVNRMNRIKKINTAQSSPTFDVFRSKLAWRGKLLDNVLINNPTDEDKKIADDIIANFLDDDKNRPFGNGFGNTEINFSLTNGYAFLGYYFLRMYNSKNVPTLPFIFKPGAVQS